MTRTLLDITRDLEALDDLVAEVDQSLAETGGEVTPEVQAALDAVDAWMAELDTDLKGKVDNYAAFIVTLDKRAEVRKAEADRLARRARIDATNAQFLKERLRGELERRGIRKVETDRYRVSVAANGGKLPLLIQDELAVPERFWISVKRVSNDLVREALERGEAVAGARLGERGRRLSIR
jgi:hypothetical protein